jgi:hypothetical protein
VNLPELKGEVQLESLAKYPSTPPAGIACGADDLAYISFTSGSTGQGKSILGRHGSLSIFCPGNKKHSNCLWMIGLACCQVCHTIHYSEIFLQRCGLGQHCVFQFLILSGIRADLRSGWQMKQSRYTHDAADECDFDGYGRFHPVTCLALYIFRW